MPCSLDSGYPGRFGNAALYAEGWRRREDHISRGDSAIERPLHFHQAIVLESGDLQYKSRNLTGRFAPIRGAELAAVDVSVGRSILTTGKTFDPELDPFLIFLENGRVIPGYAETKAGSYLRLIDSCITHLKAQGPSRTCNESKEEEEGIRRRRCRVAFGAGEEESTLLFPQIL